MPVIGAYVRYVPGRLDEVRARLERLPGIETFDLGDDERLGVLVVDDDLERAARTVEERLRAVDGVIGAVPVSVHLEDEGDYR